MDNALKIAIFFIVVLLIVGLYGAIQLYSCERQKDELIDTLEEIEKKQENKDDSNNKDPDDEVNPPKVDDSNNKDPDDKETPPKVENMTNLYRMETFVSDKLKKKIPLLSEDSAESHQSSGILKPQTKPQSINDKLVPEPLPNLQYYSVPYMQKHNITLSSAPFVYETKYRVREQSELRGDTGSVGNFDMQLQRSTIPQTQALNTSFKLNSKPHQHVNVNQITAPIVAVSQHTDPLKLAEVRDLGVRLGLNDGSFNNTVKSAVHGLMPEMKNVEKHQKQEPEDIFSNMKPAALKQINST